MKPAQNKGQTLSCHPCPTSVFLTDIPCSSFGIRLDRLYTGHFLSHLPGQESFAHITGRYDAGAFLFTFVSFMCLILKFNLPMFREQIGYYGYMYSLVFAADMYATVFKEDPLDPALGEKYKQCILVPGGSREELDSLKVCHGLLVYHTIGANGVNLRGRYSLVAHRTRRLS